MALATTTDPAGESKWRSRSDPSLWLLAGLVALGAALRFATLGQQSFWLDEAFTYRIVAHGFQHVFATVPKTESTPPLYYVLLWGWSRIFGLGEDGLRSFSAVCGILTIPVAWALGRRLASQRVGLMAAALTAVNPLLLWYSQEARSYALLVLMSAGTLLVLLVALERPSPGRLAWWGVLAALTLCTHYFALFILIPEAGWLLARLRRRSLVTVGRVAAGLGPVVAMGIVLAPLAVHQTPHATAIENTESLSTGLRLLVQQSFVGYGEPAGALTAFDLILGAVIALALVRRLDGRERDGLVPALALGCLAVAGAALIALAGSDYVNTRNMLELWPLSAIVVAAILGARRAARLGLLGLGALVSLSLFCWISLLGEPQQQRADWRGVEREIGVPSSSRAIVSYADAGIALSPYTSSLAEYPAAGARIAEIDVLSPFGSWLGAAPHPLGSEPPPAGFAIAARIRTSTYLVVRYRTDRPRVAARWELAALYPRLDPVGVFLESGGH